MSADFPDWGMHLAAGAADPGSPWRNLALGSVGLDGTPQVRTVVLRRFAGRLLEVHTDTRSAKFAELKADPAATLHGWDSASAMQLRASGRASLHLDDAAADEAWASLRAQSRATYRVRPGPGTGLAGLAPVPDATEAQARQVFCVIRLAIETVDWLHLAKDGHRRARFTWPGDAAQAAWLVP